MKLAQLLPCQSIENRATVYDSGGNWCQRNASAILIVKNLINRSMLADAMEFAFSTYIHLGALCCVTWPEHQWWPFLNIYTACGIHSQYEACPGGLGLAILGGAFRVLEMLLNVGGWMDGWVDQWKPIRSYKRNIINTSLQPKFIVYSNKTTVSGYPINIFSIF